MDTKGIRLYLPAGAWGDAPITGRGIAARLGRPPAHCPAIIATGSSGVTMHAIDIGEIQFSPTIRLFDPNGRVFFYNGRVYRAIYEHRVNFAKKLFHDGIVDSLMRKNLLVGTYLTDLELEGFGLVLRHDAIDVQIKPSEWSIVTYIEAAKQYLRLAKELSKYNLGLIDGHHSNVSLTFDGMPIWHDFGSIVENPRGSFYCNRLTEFIEYY